MPPGNALAVGKKLGRKPGCRGFFDHFSHCSVQEEVGQAKGIDFSQFTASLDLVDMPRREFIEAFGHSSSEKTRQLAAMGAQYSQS
jgi:hypothetical protein